MKRRTSVRAKDLVELHMLFEAANKFHHEVHGRPHCYINFGEPALCSFGSILHNIKVARLTKKKS